MSDVAFAESAEDAHVDEAEDAAEIEAEEDGAEAGDEEDEGEGGEQEKKPAAKAVDWEKKAHDKEGQAARERSRRREAERQLRELNERFTQFEEKSKKPATDDLEALIGDIPDPEEDPIGAVAAMKKVIAAFQGQQAKDGEAQSQQQAEQQRIARTVREMNEHEADFRADYPDYDDAVKHYRAAIREDLEEQGYAGQALDAELAKHVLALATRALSGGADPAERVYKLAQKRGFKSGEAQKTEKLRKIAETSRSTSAPSGARGAPARLTYEYVNTLKGAAFDKAFEKLQDQERRAR